MDFEKLTDKQKEEFGKSIPGSRFVRDFCCGCDEPIRVPISKLLKDNYCSNCDGHIPRGKKRYFCDLKHLRDYDNPDIDSGFDDFDYGDYDKKVNPNNFLDEI